MVREVVYMELSLSLDVDLLIDQLKSPDPGEKIRTIEIVV
jgi:hypothetical protein